MPADTPSAPSGRFPLDLHPLGLRSGLEEAARRKLRIRDGFYKLSVGTEKAPIDLSGLNLAGIDFSDMDLKHVNLTNCNLIGASFQGSNIANCTFDGADMLHANFLRSRNTSNTFNHAVMAAAILAKCKFLLCSFEGTNLQHATFLNSALFGCTFRRANINSASFIGVTVKGCELQGLRMISTNFDSALISDGDIIACKFVQCSLNTSINDSNLRQVEFIDMDMTGIASNDLTLRNVLGDNVMLMGSSHPESFRVLREHKNWDYLNAMDAAFILKDKSVLENHAPLPSPTTSIGNKRRRVF